MFELFNTGGTPPFNPNATMPSVPPADLEGNQAAAMERIAQFANTPNVLPTQAYEYGKKMGKSAKNQAEIQNYELKLKQYAEQVKVAKEAMAQLQKQQEEAKARVSSMMYSYWGDLNSTDTRVASDAAMKVGQAWGDSMGVKVFGVEPVISATGSPSAFKFQTSQGEIEVSRNDLMSTLPVSEQQNFAKMDAVKDKPRIAYIVRNGAVEALTVQDTNGGRVVDTTTGAVINDQIFKTFNEALMTTGGQPSLQNTGMVTELNTSNAGMDMSINPALVGDTGAISTPALPQAMPTQQPLPAEVASTQLPQPAQTQKSLQVDSVSNIPTSFENQDTPFVPDSSHIKILTDMSKSDSQKTVKDFKESFAAFKGAVELAKDGTGASDIALIFNIMKAFDPNSVVRESEQEMLKKAQNITSSLGVRGTNIGNTIENMLTSLATDDENLKGKSASLEDIRNLNATKELFTPETRAQFLATGYSNMRGRVENYRQNLAGAYKRIDALVPTASPEVKRAYYIAANLPNKEAIDYFLNNKPNFQAIANVKGAVDVTAPQGVPPEVWQYMTPEERKLWQTN